MLKVGITGGIGSGKSVVTKVFSTLGIPILDADALAKTLMEQDFELRKKLTEVFGNELFEAGKLNRKLLASIVFDDKVALGKLNAIVHPAVRLAGRQWMEQQNGAYSIKEAALFFESGSNVDMDFIIGVSAPLSLRLKRAMQRDKAEEETILKRMAQQMNEDEKMSRCDAIIINDGEHSLIEQVVTLHHQFLNKK